MHTKRMRFLFGYLLWFWELKTHQNRPNDNDCRWRLRFRCEHIQWHWWLHIFLHNINSIATLWCTQPSFFFLFVRLCCSLDCRTEVRVRVHQSRDIPTKQQSTCQITAKIRWKTRLGSIFPRHTRKKERRTVLFGVYWIFATHHSISAWITWRTEGARIDYVRFLRL